LAAHAKAIRLKATLRLNILRCLKKPEIYEEPLSLSALLGFPSVNENTVRVPALTELPRVPMHENVNPLMEIPSICQRLVLCV